MSKTIRLPIILFFIGACSSGKREVTIFSVPSSATPQQLEKNGFMVMRNLNALGKIDKRHDGRVQSCFMDLGYAIASASFASEDSTEMIRYTITTDAKPFRELTGLKAADYDEVEIEGEDYRVELNEENGHVVLKRLGF